MKAGKPRFFRQVARGPGATRDGRHALLIPLKLAKSNSPHGAKL
jgi:hypothetical protein